ncbi:MAG: hypothetical protein K6E63_08810 [Lachnospiraceae bacterium]|nr:hypothetical protein [Lachnospiraceae bacterium]
MTKNFEEEYRKYADSTVPDLWGRIEAAIDEADKNARNNINNEVINNSKDNVVSIQGRKIRRINPAYVTLIAACACLLLAIGVVRFIGGAKASAPMMSDSATAAAPAAAEAEAAPEAAAEAAVEYEETNDAADYAMAEEAAAEEFEAEDESFVAEAPMEMEDGAETYDATLNFDSDLKTAGSEAAKSDAAETELKVICTLEDIDEKTNTATVLITDPLDSSLNKGEELRVTVPDELLDLVRGLLDKRSSDELEISIYEKDGETYLLTGVETKK